MSEIGTSGRVGQSCCATTEREHDMAENGPDDALNDEEIAAAQGGGVDEGGETSVPMVEDAGVSGWLAQGEHN